MAAKGKGNGDDAGLDLDITQDQGFQRREWRFETFGWVLLVLFIVAGLLGFLGTGPFSKTTADSGDGSFEVEYHRVIHHQAEESLSFSFTSAAVQDRTVTLELTGPWVSGVDISTISPTPSTQYATPGGVAMEFEVLEPGDVEVAFSFRATEYWGLGATATVNDDSAAFSQLVLP